MATRSLTLLLLQVISVVGEGVMSPEQMKQVMEMLKEVLSQVKERLLKREGTCIILHIQFMYGGINVIFFTAKKVGDDVDDEEKDFIDELQEKEDMITTELADCVGIMARYYKQAFVPIFHEYTPLAQALLGPETRDADKQLGLCMFDDIIEHGGQLSAQYVQPYLPVLIGFANNEHNGIRQASVYGLGVCAQHAVDTFKPFVKGMFARVLTDVRYKALTYLTQTPFKPLEMSCQLAARVTKRTRARLRTRSPPLARFVTTTATCSVTICLG